MIHRVGTIRPNLHLKDSIGAAPADSFDGNSNRGQILGESMVIDGEIDEVANPLRRKFHEKSF
jgi:hypothetical protein